MFCFCTVVSRFDPFLISVGPLVDQIIIYITGSDMNVASCDPLNPISEISGLMGSGWVRLT